MKPIALFVCLVTACSVQGQTNYPYVITTVAGTYPLGDGGPATAALLLRPEAVAVDAAGNLYIADSQNHRVRKVTPSGQISTVIGNGTVVGALVSGGPAAGARITNPLAVAVDRFGSLYVIENGAILRRIMPTGIVATVAGSGETGYSGDGQPAAGARFRNARGLALDAAGNVYVADSGNHRVRKIDMAGIITTVAGTGVAGYNGDNRQATTAQLNFPEGIAVDSAGILYISEVFGHRVRMVTGSGNIMTVAGDGVPGYSGDDRAASAARLNYPYGVAVDQARSVYIADRSNQRVRKISPEGIITTVAGNGTYEYSGDGGPARSATLANPVGVAVDAAGNVWIADNMNNRIRKVTPDGMISTVAGASHFGGDGGPGTSASLESPGSVALDASGNLYIADEGNGRIRKLTPSGTITTVAGTGKYLYDGETKQTPYAALAYPRSVVADAAGNLYFIDASNNADNSRVRKLSPSGQITAVAGNGTVGYSGDGKAAVGAQLRRPQGLALDRLGNLYIADSGNNVVRKVTPDGTISTCAGTGTPGYSGEGQLATVAKLDNPAALATDAVGNLYIADFNNSRVRMLSPSGIITLVAGNGTSGRGGDGGPALTAQVNPSGLAVDAAGNLYIAQPPVIRKVGRDGIITRIAGTGFQRYEGDGGFSADASVNDPRGMVVDAAGTVWFADQKNHRIRKLVVNSPVQLAIVSGNAQSGPVGTTLPSALVVKLAGAGGLGVAGVAVNYGVTSGSATLSSASTVTDSSGLAGIQVKLGSAVGPVTVTASFGGLPPVRFSLTATEAAGPVVVGPRIAAGGVAGVGGSVPPVKQISPNGLVSIYGENFAPAGTARAAGADDLVGGRVPTKLAGVCVEVGGQRAPVLAVYPHQINIQVPTLSAPAEPGVQVILKCGETGEQRSNPEKAALQAASPEFLYFMLNADGKNPIAAVSAVTGVRVGPPGLIAGVTFMPAQPGDILTLYATGFGLTDPVYQAGELASGIAPVVEAVKVTVGGAELAADDILYAGVTPGLAGVYQLNLRLPGDLPEGDLPVVVRVGAFSSPAGGYVTVKR